MKRLLCMMMLSALVAFGAPIGDARAQTGEAQVMPVETAEFWIARLRAHYREHAVRERVTITVDHGAERGREHLLFACQPLEGFREPEVFVDLGAIEIWTRPPGEEETGAGTIRLAHELDIRHYYEVPPIDGATTARTWRDALPPLMLPQLSLALGGPLFPEVGRVEWTDARERSPVVGAPMIELAGEAGDAKVALVVEADETPRIVEARIDARPGPVRIVCRSEDLEPKDGRLGYDIARRERLESLGDVMARPGDVGAGDALPDMPIIYFTLGSDSPTEAYKHRLMLFFDGHAVGDSLPRVEQAALDALRLGAERVGPTTRIDPIGVLDTFRVAGEIQRAELRLQEAVDPDYSFYSLSDKHTRKRFSAESDAVIVVASKEGVVAGVIDLAGIEERLNEEGRDRVVASLADRVESLCRLINRRERGEPDG